MSQSVSGGGSVKVFLFLALICALAAGAWLLWRTPDPQPEDTGDGVAPAMREPSQQELRERFEQASARAVQPDPAQQLRDTIEAQRAVVEADPTSQDAPGILNAMGNLYLQRLMDYRSAAEAYQRVLIEYPAWEGAYQVFPQLEICYDQLGDGDGLRWLWTQMMERFPPESDLHKYGAQQLGLPPRSPTPPNPEEAAEPELPPATEDTPNPPAAPESSS